VSEDEELDVDKQMREDKEDDATYDSRLEIMGDTMSVMSGKSSLRKGVGKLKRIFGSRAR